MLPSGQRLADDNIYLQNDRFQKPKEIFKLIAARIMALPGAGTPLDILDVGCATGELLFHLGQVLGPHHKYTGVDVSGAMLKLAKTMVPAAEFSALDISADAGEFARAHDVVICSGVLGIFDDLTVPLRNLLKLCKPGGVILAFTDVNETDIDLISRYRRVGEANAPWETGWNIFSKRTIKTIAIEAENKCRVNFLDFELPFDVPENADPMRNWTIKIDERRLCTNGAGLLLREKLIEIYK